MRTAEYDVIITAPNTKDIHNTIRPEHKSGEGTAPENKAIETMFQRYLISK